ncbi:MAG: hypothetical protein H6717_30045 [Polyangiaceae bacterium]|nr:hypothetical protein [Polyangiaceae bacterium]
MPPLPALPPVLLPAVPPLPALPPAVPPLPPLLAPAAPPAAGLLADWSSLQPPKIVPANTMIAQLARMPTSVVDLRAARQPSRVRNNRM